MSGYLKTASITQYPVDGSYVKGRTDQAGPATGFLGEIIRNTPTDTRTTMPTTDVAKTICSLPLTPGGWIIFASAAIDVTSTTLTRAQLVITTGSSIIGSIVDDYYTELSASLSLGYAIGTIAGYPVYSNGSTTYNLVIKPTYTGSPGSTALSGKIWAVRRT